MREVRVCVDELFVLCEHQVADLAQLAVREWLREVALGDEQRDFGRVGLCHAESLTDERRERQPVHVTVLPVGVEVLCNVELT